MMIRVERDIEAQCHQCGDSIPVDTPVSPPWCALCDVWICERCWPTHVHVERETIHAVAIMASAPDSCRVMVYTLPRPARHWNVLDVMATITPPPPPTRTQGFLTSLGRFVGRKEAWDIAERENQIVRNVGCDGTLFSENLW